MTVSDRSIIALPCFFRKEKVSCQYNFIARYKLSRVNFSIVTTFICCYMRYHTFLFETKKSLNYLNIPSI